MNPLKKRLGTVLCALALLCTLLPPSAAASNVCFTALNDSLLPLNAGTMPVWSGGVLYVPYSVFDSGSTGISLGINCAVSRSNYTVTLFNLRKIMVFDLSEGTCRDQQTQQLLPGHAITRNSKTYLPAALICDFFDLPTPTYSYTAYGQLVRIKGSDAVLSDSKFIDAAGNQMSSRLREYHQSLTPPPETPETPVVTPPAVVQPEEDPESPTVPSYLAFLWEGADGMEDILSALQAEGRLGLFFFPPEELRRQDDLIRRLLGTGHSVGILALGGTPEETQSILAEGNRILQGITHTQTRYAYCRESQRAAFTLDGWVCWRESVNATPDGKRTAAAHAYQVLHQLERRSGTAYLTLDTSQNTAAALPTLLRQLSGSQYVVGIPMETRL